MAAIISTRINEKYNRHVTVSVRYPSRVDVDPVEAVVNGKILPRTKGFPCKYDPPSVSFKTYRALCNWGHKKIANYVLQNRKRSFVTPNYVWNGVLEFGKSTPPRLRNQSYDYALGKVASLLKLDEKIPIRCMDESKEYIPRSTSPGLPWIHTCPGQKKGEILDKYFFSVANYWNRVGRGEPVIPLPDCAAFSRSHISTPDKNKVRPVWAYPLSAICQESRFAVPLLDLLKDQKILPNSAYGMEMMKGGMTWLNSQVLRARRLYPGCKFLMVDYSAFDSSIPAWLIRDAFSLIERKFDFSRVLVDGVEYPVDPEGEKRKFKKIVNYFINTTIRSSDGRRFQKNHGVPSGTMFTNIIDTIVNLIVTYTLCDAVIGCEPVFELAFGDDSFICLPSHAIADLDALSEAARMAFGMTINVKKSYATSLPSNIQFLGYYNNGGSPVKDPVDLIASMLYPQFEKDDWGYCVSRALGCILAGAGSSTDVFLCGQAVWHYASRFPESLDAGLVLIRENPRSRRFLDQMGCGELPLSHDFFFDITLGIPSFDCTKMMKNVNLVKGSL